MIAEEEKRQAVIASVAEVDGRHDGALMANRFMDKCCHQAAYGVFAWLEANGFEVVQRVKK